MKRKPKFIWTEKGEKIFYFIIIGIIVVIWGYFYPAYRNTYTYHNLPWFAKINKVAGKIIKIEEEKLLVQRLHAENLDIDYKIVFSYNIDNQYFTNYQTIKSTLKNEIWFKKFAQKQLDSTVIVEYSVNNFSQSKIDIANLIK